MTMPQTGHYEMKDSGVEWIGKMPSHWSASPFKKIIAQNDGGVWGEDPIGDDGAVVLRSTEQTVDGKWNIEQPAKRDLSHVAKLRYYKLEIGDLLITKSSGSALHIGKTSIVDADIAKLHCFYSNFMQRVRLNQNVMPKLYWYILNSSIARYQFVFLQNSTSGIGNINSKHIDNIIVPVPPLSEQTAIAAYLDEKCATIDAIIAEAKSSIEEYKSWKASVIFETVTKGLNPNAEMKDSGVEWIGEMPGHWEIQKAKYYITVTNGSDPVTEGEIPVYGSGSKSFRTCGEYKEGPTVLVGRKGSIDKPRYVTGRYWNVDTAFDVKTKGFDLRLYYYLATCFDYQFYMSQTTLPSMTQTNYRNMFLPVPPLPEQTAIAAYLDSKCAAIDGIILEKEDLIRELENYKRSLIFEVVTGKRRVC